MTHTFLQRCEEGKAQLAKCRVEPKAKYDWSKLDAGWEERAGELRCYGNTGSVHPFSVEWLERQADDYAPDRTMVVAGWCDLYPIARAQLAKCRVVDNTPLFEAMDRMAAEMPVEEWKNLPQVVEAVETAKRLGEETAQWMIDAVANSTAPEPSDIAIGPFVRFYGVPWKVGPLASWTLVNISAHDGRLTVVMKRGRGEVVIETGVDDETLWERLMAKVVEIDKAKAAEEAKEKSDV